MHTSSRSICTKHVKSPRNSQFCKVCNLLRPKTILDIRKKTFLQVNNKPVVNKLLKDFSNNRNKAYKVPVGSHIFPFNISKLRRGHRWDFPTLWKARLFQTNSASTSSDKCKFPLAVFQNYQWNTTRSLFSWRIKSSYDQLATCHLESREVTHTLR